jgi:hypothetical protein
MKLHSVTVVFLLIASTALASSFGLNPGFGLVPPDPGAPVPKGLNNFFRHLSVGYISSSKTPAWNLVRKWNWANAGLWQYVSPVRDQGTCSKNESILKLRI